MLTFGPVDGEASTFVTNVKGLNVAACADWLVVVARATPTTIAVVLAERRMVLCVVDVFRIFL